MMLHNVAGNTLTKHKNVTITCMNLKIMCYKISSLTGKHAKVLKIKLC